MDASRDRIGFQHLLIDMALRGGVDRPALELVGG